KGRLRPPFLFKLFSVHGESITICMPVGNFGDLAITLRNIEETGGCVLFARRSFGEQPSPPNFLDGIFRRLHQPAGKPAAARFAAHGNPIKLVSSVGTGNRTITCVTLNAVRPIGYDKPVARCGLTPSEVFLNQFARDAGFTVAESARRD